MRAGLVVAVCLVGCNSHEPSREVPRPEPRAPEPATPVRDEPPTPKPAPNPIDLSLGDGFEMRRPIQDGRLALIPIVATREQPAREYITLQEGMARGLVSVRELGGEDEWQVPTVRVTNRARVPLFIMDGELIVEAMQDRVTAEQTVILAGQTEEIEVRCVEEDRDHGGRAFRPGHAIAEPSLRRTVAHAEQEQVWAQVKQINRRHGLAPRTNTYRHAAALQSKGVSAERRGKLLEQLAALEERHRMVGVAVVIDNQVIAIDRFASPALYQKLEPLLLASYLPDTEGPARPAEGQRLSPDAVRRFVRDTGGHATDASSSVLRPL